MTRHPALLIGAVTLALGLAACGSSNSSTSSASSAAATSPAATSSAASSVSTSPAASSTTSASAPAASSSSSSRYGSSAASSTTPAAAPAASSTTSASAPAAPVSSTVSEAVNPNGTLMFTRNSLVAKAGKVTIHFTNTTPLAHNFTVQQGTSGPVVGATPTFKGGTKSLTLNLKAGSYTFYCTVPGHRAAGMQGTLIVK